MATIHNKKNTNDNLSLYSYGSFVAIKKPKKQTKTSKEVKNKNINQKKDKKIVDRVKNPIGMKLVAIISTILIISLGGVTYLVSFFVSRDVRTSAEENNLSVNTRTASACESTVTNAVSSVEMFLDLISDASEDETAVKLAEERFFSHNKDIAAVYQPSSMKVYLNQAFFIAREIDSGNVNAYFEQETDSVHRAANGSTELLNASPFFLSQLACVFTPIRSLKDKAVGILFSTENLGEALSSGSVNQSFFVNNDGIVIVHSDLQKMMDGTDESKMPIVQSFQKSSQSNNQITYQDYDGEEYIGAFRKLGNGYGAVITTVKTSIVLEGVRATTRRNIYITIAILSFSILIIYFFSKTLSVPLKKLTATVNEINQGNFNTELFGDLKTNGRDEIGVLARSTKNEREILNTFTKLTNKGVTQAIIKKEIDFEPHLKDITIFFSDIRGFTAISDGFKKRFGEESAAKIISFLNDYMSRMVTCISLTGGTVDKFEGDAIMACWGVLRNESLDWEEKPLSSAERALKKKAHDKYVKADALSGIISCIAMRYSLMKYNKDAEIFTRSHQYEMKADYKPYIKIGAGLNSGRATVGFMGSFEKMEFTSIGDAVNFASRTEASNKPCGTDILITEDTYNILKKDYIKCRENNFVILPENRKNEIIVEQIPVEFEVKGKGKQHFYGVVNMPQFNIEEFFRQGDPDFRVDRDCIRAAGPTGPKNMAEVRKLLGIPTPDFEKVNLNEEENKIQVASS